MGKKEITIPAMGESISEVVIGTFLKEEGSAVVTDDEMVEIETEKVNQVLYAPASGAVHYTVKEGDTVLVESVIGYIDTEAQAKAPVKEVPPSPPPVEEKPVETVRESKESFVKGLDRPAAPLKAKKIGNRRGGG